MAACKRLVPTLLCVCSGTPSLVLAALAAFSLLCCAKRDVAATRQEPPLARGAKVVVEETASEFFEGTVLALEGERLKVQALVGGDVLSVARGDVTPLLALRTHALAPGFAICRVSGQSWAGCRVLSVDPGSAAVELSDGTRSQLGALDVVPASELSVLNITRRFQREAAQRAFAQEAKSLKPRVPPQFRPAPHERLIAGSDGGFWSASVRELVDGGAYVDWSDGRPSSRAELAQLAPLPPYHLELHRGDFVLLPPAALAERWSVARVERVVDHKLGGTRSDGEHFESDERSVVPLGP